MLGMHSAMELYPRPLFPLFGDGTGSGEGLHKFPRQALSL